MFNVIISVPEEWTDYGLLREKCDYFLSNKIKSGEKITVLSGHTGLVSKYASDNNLDFVMFSADWKRLGKKALYLRNLDMVNTGNACIAFLSSYSENREQLELIKIAKGKNLMVREIKEDE